MKTKISKEWMERMVKLEADNEISGGETWNETCARWKSQWPLHGAADDKHGIDLYHFMHVLNKHLIGNESIVIDAGSSLYAVCQSIRCKEGTRLIASGAQADMGFALPASIGVWLADKSRRVIVIVGDGSFQCNIQELATVKYHGAPITFFVWNNNGYLSIRNTQTKFYEGRVWGTDKEHGLWFPELVSVAETYGMDYVRVETHEELEHDIGNVLGMHSAIIVEVMCNPNQEIMPSLNLKPDKDGKMNQCPLDDMWPWLPPEELAAERAAAKGAK